MIGLLTGKTVLLVEDEPLIAMTVTDMLGALDAARTIVAGDVARALKRLEDGAFDAAILDANLNGERSDKVAETLRLLGVPIVHATGYAEMLSPPETEPVIAKPYTEESLAAALMKAMRTE